jgi:succinate dehydrogenase / fumarate reductase iron-sulfur subunit
MIAPKKQFETFRLRVKRQDRPDSEPYWETFELQYKPNMNIISALQAVAAKPVTADGKQSTPVSYLAACLEEVCGSCTALVNGHVCQMCSQLVDDYLGDDGVITLEPMSKFPVVRDLEIDRSRLFEDLKDINGWVPIDGTYDLGHGPTESPKDQDRRYKLSRCMSCGCCLEVCPQYTLDNTFVGAAVISQVEYFNSHPTGRELKDERLKRMESVGGVNDCGNAQNCVKVCPKEIPLTESIARVGRSTTIHSIKKFFTGD